MCQSGRRYSGVGNLLQIIMYPQAFYLSSMYCVSRFPFLHISACKLITATAKRPRPRLFSLIIAALPISQHLAVIGLFLAVFYRLLIDSFGAGEVGWSTVLLSLSGYTVRRWGWSYIPRASNPSGKMDNKTARVR